ncbi:MAG: TolC family protein [Chitinophagales bacterium]
MNWNCKRLFLGIFLFWYFPGFAQENLTLADAIQRALQNNYQINIVQAQTEITDRNNSWLATGMFPSLSAGGSGGINYSEPNNPINPFQNFPTRTTNVGGQVELNWTLFNGLRVYAEKDRLALLHQQSEGNAAIVVENTVQAVLLAYYQALLQKEKLEVQKSVLQLSKDRYRYAEESKELGASTSFDALQFQTAFLSDSANYLSQKVAYDNSLLQLKLIMAEEEEAEFTLSDSLQFQGREYELDLLKSQLKNNNKTLRNQYINAQIFQKELALAKRAQSPSLNMNGGVSYNKNYFYTDQFPAYLRDPTIPQGETTTINSSGSTLNYYANFTLSFNIFNNLQVRRAIQNTKVQERIAEIQVDEMEQEMNVNIEKALKLYATQKTMLAVTALNEQSAALNLQMAEERLKNGSINSLDFRNIQTDYLRIASNNLEALYNALEAETELLRLSGVILGEVE